MVSDRRTIGESQFEAYLDSMKYAYEFEKEFPGKSKRPDYTVTKDGTVVICDVKDFSPLLPQPRGIQQFDAYKRIRERIADGRRKFKEFKEFPCCVVMQNNQNFFVPSEKPEIVLGAMYGDAGFTVPIYLGDDPPPKPPPAVQRAFLGGGKMIRGNDISNTTISALLTIRRVPVGLNRLKKIWKEFPHVTVNESREIAAQQFPNFDADETCLGVIVWENAVARIRLSRDFFNGPFDERWGVEGEQQTITFHGDGLD